MPFFIYFILLLAVLFRGVENDVIISKNFLE